MNELRNFIIHHDFNTIIVLERLLVVINGSNALLLFSAFFCINITTKTSKERKVILVREDLYLKHLI